MKKFLMLLLAGMALSGPLSADEADVVAVEVKQEAGGVYGFSVTVRHADEGWQHFADMWKVFLPNGVVAATRVLNHPHVGEQPFTRGISGVKIPAGVKSVTIRVHDSVHHYGGKEFTVKLAK